MKPVGRIAEVNGYTLTENWYEGMKINTTEQDLAALHEAWGTASKYRGEECGRCRGRGYTRKDGRVGCIVCGGTGVVGAKGEGNA